MTFRDDVVTLGADGAFELGPLASGEATVFLFPPANFQSGFSSGGGKPRGARELGVVTIPPAGVVERDFSLVEAFPGTVRVTVSSNGAPLAGMKVHHVSEEGDRLEAGTDADGATAAVPLFPGPWSVYVVDEENGWAHRHAGFLWIDAAVEHALHVEVSLVAGAVVLIDAETREPLANRKIAIWPHFEERNQPSLFNVYRETDDEGRLTLEVPPGEYRLHLGELHPEAGEGEAREGFLTWTDQGPATEELDL